VHHKGMTPSEPGTSMNSAEVKERRTRIETAIQNLPERCRQVFSKSRMEGKKYALIATEMDISIKTVEVQMGKALKILREQLADLIVTFFIYLIIR
jgi:RNA polymerase sigma-70 factor (ECF subfamily)